MFLFTYIILKVISNRLRTDYNISVDIINVTFCN